MRTKIKKISFFLVFLSLCFFVYSKTSALTVDEINQRIEQKSQELENLEKENAEYQKKLLEIGGSVKSLNDELNLLKLTQQKLASDIKITKQKIEREQDAISGLSVDINDKDTLIGSQKKSIAVLIRDMDVEERTPLITKLLRNESLSDSWNEIEQSAIAQQKMVEHIDNLSSVKDQLFIEKSSREVAKKKLEELQATLAGQEKVVKATQNDTQSILKETKNSESGYRLLLAENEKRRKAFEDEIRSYESELKYILDPNSIPKAGSAPFSWPLSDVLITQFFGKTSASGRLYASGSHSGVDFRASIGTPVLAMADGVVEGSGDTDTACKRASFGKWVFIRYDNGLASTYGHLSAVSAQTGQRVRRGDVVAYSGNTGYSTGPHLHVTVYAGDAVKVDTKPSISCKGKILTQPLAAINAYLDPMLYMPTPLAGQVKSGAR